MPRKKSVPRWRRLLAAALATGVIGGGAALTLNHPQFRGEYVMKVIDGDTFVLGSGQPIRLSGLNAPELAHCMGKDAHKALSALVLHKRVILREPVADNNRRIVALVYADGKLVNEAMIRSGLAQYMSHGSSQPDVMKSANAYARDNKIGIFSSLCTQTEPPDPKCRIKGNYHDGKRIVVYYTSECGSYQQVIVYKFQGDEWFCSEEEAIAAGFTKSDTCP